ncbi:DUF192 domain-containing protein [Bacillus sp. PS06]|uniref:DUF192 domain-containing protein n=1 Tax=Bacillus sp. PS06 TaxID=2764176 RepID=UPI00178699E4|nr:DUF192 domain-containing protein [Bacillus sp. PS06]MBD8069120.1 DUF192 domain-containing protein [Bacillus sp. PS06]
MKLQTGEKSKEIPIQVKEYHTFFKRFKGLMFRVEPIENEGIWIKPCNSIHMFFMFFSIDVVFLNEEMRIIALKENVKPWTLIFPIKHATSVIEFPQGTISSYSFAVGDTIQV